jgi:hypothetical protein
MLIFFPTIINANHFDFLKKNIEIIPNDIQRVFFIPFKNPENTKTFGLSMAALIATDRY